MFICNHCPFVVHVKNEIVERLSEIIDDGLVEVTRLISVIAISVTQPLVVPIDASILRVITYRGKKPMGRMMHMPVEELKKRSSKNK